MIVAFQCPQCLTRDSLSITLAMQFPPDNRSDDITLQVVRCSNCGFQGLAVYEESRRGAWEHESWDHTGYQVGPEVLENLAEVLKSCQTPYNTACSCPAHTRFGRQDGTGRWLGLQEIEVLETFPMRLAS
jgi:Zn ribbon nucleic-acid-binding protein